MTPTLSHPSSLTTSPQFDELVDQFIPNNTTWRGWLRMAFQQPLVPVLPVARELFSKTKWGGQSNKALRLSSAVASPESSSASLPPSRTSSRMGWRRRGRSSKDVTDGLAAKDPERSPSRPRVRSLLKRDKPSSPRITAPEVSAN